MEQLYNILSEFERDPKTYVSIGLVSLSIVLGIVNYYHNRNYRIKERGKLEEKIMDDNEVD